MVEWENRGSYTSRIVATLDTQRRYKSYLIPGGSVSPWYWICLISIVTVPLKSNIATILELLRGLLGICAELIYRFSYAPTV